MRERSDSRERRARLVSSGVTKCCALTWPGTTNVPRFVLGQLGVYGLILGRLPLRVFSIGKYAFQKKNHGSWQTFRKVSLAGIEPVGFRGKSDLRNHQAIVQPRLCDSLMVTHITLAA